MTKYDGTRQKLEVSGAPEDAQIEYFAIEKGTGEDNIDVYTENGARKPGSYGVKAVVTIGGDQREYTAVLTIRKANMTIAGNTLIKDAYAPDPEFTYTITGLLPCDEFVVLPAAAEETEEPAAPSVLPSAVPSASLLPSVTPSETPAEDVDGGAKFYGELVITSESTRYSEAGEYKITFGGVASDCYNITYRTGALKIRSYETELLGGIDGGLKQNINGEMTYGGKAVLWQGTNNFSLFAGCFSGGEVNEQGVQNAFAGLEELAAYNVKAIRFSCGHFFDWNWKQNWIGDSETGVSRAEMNMYTLKRLFNKAASLNIGLIPSVYWTNNIMGMFGENIGDGWGTEGSKTWNFALEYQELLMDALNDHPALFMWEFGNEWNLSTDVSGDSDVNKRLTKDILHNFRSAWSSLVASRNDGYNRVIGSGDSILRNCQYNRGWNNGSWTEDTEREHREALKYFNPGITAVSAHIYGGAKLVILQDRKVAEKKKELNGSMSVKQELELRNQIRKQYYEDPESVEKMYKEYGITDGYMDVYNKNIEGSDTLAGQYRLILNSAKYFGATAYVGETGIGYTFGETVLQNGEYAHAQGYYPDISYDDVTYYSEQVTKAQQETGMPLILYWNYEYNVNVTRIGDDVYWGKNYLTNDNPNDDYLTFSDHGTGTEYSMSLKNWEKARRVFAEVKKVNDDWDAKNA